MGRLPPRLRRPRARPHPHRLLEIRRPDPGEERVCADHAEEFARDAGGGTFEQFELQWE